MLFNYKAIDQSGAEVTGAIDAINEDVAVSALQRRGLVIVSLEDAGKKSFLQREAGLGAFNRVPARDVVILSRQISTLFEAQVSALKIFNLLAAETENEVLRRVLEDVSADLQGGSSISRALEKHPKIFSPFYVNMVKVGEESGKLEEIFLRLADYLDRMYEITSKARNALIYPVFVVITFIAVMVLMLTAVIPKIGTILEESGGEIPVYTKAVLAASDVLVQYGPYLLVLVVVGAFFLVRHVRSEAGALSWSRFKISVPYIGSLYRKLYLARIADNMQTMLLAGIPAVKAIETTADVVDNKVYRLALMNAAVSVRGGATLAKSFGESADVIPGIVTQMIKIGEETGELGKILDTLGKFYRREVNNAVDTLVDLIEPVMIVLLGLGVGFLLASVLIPIYNISSAIG